MEMWFSAFVHLYLGGWNTFEFKWKLLKAEEFDISIIIMHTSPILMSLKYIVKVIILNNFFPYILQPLGFSHDWYFNVIYIPYFWKQRCLCETNVRNTTSEPRATFYQLYYCSEVTAITEIASEPSAVNSDCERWRPPISKFHFARSHIEPGGPLCIWTCRYRGALGNNDFCEKNREPVEFERNRIHGVRGG